MLYGSSENDLRKNPSEISPQTGTFSEQVIETFEYKVKSTDMYFYHLLLPDIKHYRLFLTGHRAIAFPLNM